MHTISQELDQVLDRLDPQTASLLEQAVRDALALASHRSFAQAKTDPQGYPEGYFEANAGSFLGEALERPGDFHAEGTVPA
jgi:hypothetical protein